MRFLFDMNRLYGSMVVLSLLCLSPQVWGQETGVKIIVRPEAVLTAADVEKVHADIRQKLSKKLDVLCPEAELGRVIDEFAAKLDLTIVFDPIGLEEAAVTKDQIISHNLRGISGNAALRIMLTPLNLTYVIANESLEITSKEKAAEKLSIKVYDCRDLLEMVPKVPVVNILPNDRPFVSGASSDPAASKIENPKLDIQRKIMAESKETMLNGNALVNLLSGSIEPETWMDNGGRGTIEPFGGLIIVNQTREAHDEIERLLSTMRELVKKTPAK